LLSFPRIKCDKWIRGETGKFQPIGLGGPARGLPVPVRDASPEGSVDAEDLVQETFLAAFKDRISFSGNSSEATWLVGILKHKIADHFRHLARAAPLEDGDLREQPDPSPFDGSGHWAKGPTDWGGNPADLYREKKFLDQLAKCLSGLSPNHANLPIGKRIGVRVHLLMCKLCARYERQLLLIREAVRRMVATEEKPGGVPGESLSEEAKERIRKSLRNP
jgi:hypothetical protein